MRKRGATYAEIAKELKHPKSTVATTIKKAKLRPQGKSQPRSGQPLKTTARDRRLILFVIKRNPDITDAKIREETGIKISNASLYRILQDFYMKHWIKKKRPLLDADHARARLD